MEASAPARSAKGARRIISTGSFSRADMDQTDPDAVQGRLHGLRGLFGTDPV